MIRYFLVLILAGLAAAAEARPLVTSSEDTLARICLARELSPERIVDACDGALSEAGLTGSQRVEMMIARADGFLWQENYQAAVAGYREAIDADPTSVDAWNGLGWALREIEGDAAAYEVFETSLGIEVSVQGLSGKAATGRKIGAMSDAEARDMLRASLTVDPDYIWALREIGWSLLEDKLPVEAEDAFQEALERDPEDVNARYGLGRAALNAGDADRALSLFNDVLADAPDNFAARVYRIITLRKLDRNAQALRDSDRLIEEYPNRTSGYIERGLSLLALQRRAEAIQTYEMAEKVLGESNSIYYWHADALATDGQFEAAMSMIDRGLALSGSDHTDHLLKSYIALEMRDYDTSRRSAETVLNAGVDDPWAHYYIAISLVHSGNTKESLLRFDRAMETGLPEDRVGAFAKELISAGKYVEAAQLRLKY